MAVYEQQVVRSAKRTNEEACYPQCRLGMVSDEETDVRIQQSHESKDEGERWHLERGDEEGHGKMERSDLNARCVAESIKSTDSHSPRQKSPSLS